MSERSRVRMSSPNIIKAPGRLNKERIKNNMKTCSIDVQFRLLLSLAVFSGGFFRGPPHSTFWWSCLEVKKIQVAKREDASSLLGMMSFLARHDDSTCKEPSPGLQSQKKKKPCLWHRRFFFGGFDLWDNEEQKPALDSQDMPRPSECLGARHMNSAPFDPTLSGALSSAKPVHESPRRIDQHAEPVDLTEREEDPGGVGDPTQQKF